MSTLRTFNLQNPDSGTVNIEMDQGGNTLMTGIATVRGAAHFTSTSGSDAVGIGTDITAYKLDVRVTGAEAGLRVYNPDTSSNASGIIRLGNDDNQNSAFLKLNGANNSSTVGGAANLVLGTGTAREVHLATSGTSRFKITSSGVKQVLNGNLNIYQTYIDFSGDQSSTPHTAVALYRPADGTFAISTQNTERLRVDSSGRVLIGRTSTQNENIAGIGYANIVQIEGNAIGEGLSVANSAAAARINITRDLASNSITNGMDLGFISFGSESPTSVERARIQCNAEFTNANERGGRLQFYTSSDGAFTPTERLRIDSDGRIAQGGRTPTSHGSPNLLIWGSDPTVHLTSTGSTANTSYTGIKFAVAGGSTGDYSKAGIFVQRQDSYNDLDMIFAFRSSNDATGVAISDEKIRINSDGYLGIGHHSPNTRLYVRESGASISSGNAILNSTQEGIRLVNSNNDNTSLGLWFTTGDSHHSGISGQRNDSANTWGTDLRFYTHEDATNDVTYTRERLRINPHGLLINRRGQNAVNTGGNILGRYKYTQQNQGSGYAHLILGPDGRKLQDYVTTNCYCIITVTVTGTGTNNMFCQYYYQANSSAGTSSLNHMYGNNSASSNRPYMNLQNTHDPAWVMTHNGGYRQDIEVAIYGGAPGYTYITEFGDFTTNP